MQRFASILVLALPLCALTAAHADPLYDFTIAQNGNVLALRMADPLPQRIARSPSEVQLYLSGSGVYDGASDARFDWDLFPQGPDNFQIYVNGRVNLEFAGYSLPFLSRGADLRDPAGDDPSPYSGCIDPCYDAVFHFIPGSYAFAGYLGPVDLTITQDAGSAVTPEPGTLLLLSTGVAASLAEARRRRRSGARCWRGRLTRGS